MVDPIMFLCALYTRFSNGISKLLIIHLYGWRGVLTFFLSRSPSRKILFLVEPLFLNLSFHIFGSVYYSQVKTARDAFRRCLTLRLPNRQHQPRSPVEGLTSRTLLRECKGVPTISLQHSLCAYMTLVLENGQRGN